LHYNRHRYYKPEIGRYISADPIGLRSDLNLYAYVQNDPVNWVDPEGLDAATWGRIGTFTTGFALEFVPSGVTNAVGLAMMMGAVATIPGDTPINQPMQMAKGKQTPRNWATEQAKKTAQTNNTDPCDELSKMLDEAKCNGDNQKVQAITQAQKFLKCRNKNKRQNHY